jgi:hypothetical protein
MGKVIYDALITGVCRQTYWFLSAVLLMLTAQKLSLFGTGLERLKSKLAMSRT